MKPETVYIGRNGELLSRKLQPELSLADRKENWRRRMGRPEQREATFLIF